MSSKTKKKSTMPPIPSKIKSIYIELPQYQFNHSSSSGHNDHYIGRDRSIERLKMLLLHADTCESGTYLVAGYRGMGKTSLVDRVIREINEDGPRFWDIHISLSQDDIRDFDVLKLIASQLALEWDDKIRQNEFGSIQNTASFIHISDRLRHLSNNLNSIVKNHTNVKKTNRLQKQRKFEAYAQQIITDENLDQEWTRSELLSKEVERELIHILDLISNLRRDENPPIPQFVFVLDELDKIEPSHFYQQEYQSSNIPSQEELDKIYGANRVRRRQEVISKLLANLKSFLNNAKAKFIFIGGREMYDASLADIADRDSFYSSIFHDVIYVSSFFKDKFSVARSGLTRLTEAFLCKIITPKSYMEKYWQLEPEKITDDRYTLKVYFHYLIDLHTKENKYKNAVITAIEDPDKSRAVYKLIFFLQNFVLFLAYRSNGTPKKIVSILESYIQEVSLERLNNPNYLVVRQKETTPAKRLLCFKFGYRDQYEIGLTANIYRPYVITHSRYLKSLGDKLLYSSAYIIDYMLKFHSNAFSWRNLELLPEIILVNKDPNLRYFISNILNFLSGMYIRETTSGMFQYKYYSKAAHEITLLTKISETASAAFNFTLDESLHIIQYYRRKLNQLRKSHPNYAQEFIHSIGFIESILGDLYYFDKEYDEAIVYYTNAIQVLRRMAEQEPNKMTKHQIVLYVKNSLHLGLCLEKIRAFDSAYTIYRSLILNTPRLLEKVMDWTPDDNQSEKKMADDEWDKPIRRMQLLIKPHIALLDLIEKQRMDGITYANLSRNHKEVFSFLVDVKAAKPETTISIGQGVVLSPTKLKMDSMRVSVLFSDYYSNVGSLLFYKNRNFPELQKLLLDNKLVFENKSDVFSLIEQMRGDFDHYNPSLSGFTYYYLGLKELVNAYLPQLQAIQMLGKAGTKQYSPDDNALVKSAYLLYPECQGVVGNTLLFTFGNIISRLGDALLACISNVNLQKHELNLDLLSSFGDPNYDENLDINLRPITEKILEHLNTLHDQECQLQSWCTINSVLALYRMAGLFYLRAGRIYSYAFQYKKVLFLLRDHLQFFNWQSRTELESTKSRLAMARKIKDICEHVAERIIGANTWISDVSNRPQVLKYREIFRVPSKNFDLEETRLIYLNLSTNPEIRETIALTEEIKLKLLNRFKISLDKLPTPRISPYDLISSRYARVFELRHQSELNFYLLKKYGWHKLLKSRMLWNLRLLNFQQTDQKKWGKYPELGEKLMAQLKNNANHFDFNDLMVDIQFTSTPKINLKEMSQFFTKGIAQLNPEGNMELEIRKRFPELFLTAETCKAILDVKIRTLICDSIFALFEVTRTLNIYGISYISSHSFLANIHYKLADWCSIAANYDLIRGIARDNWPKQFSASEPELRVELKKTLGEEDVHYLDPNYHNELAIQHFNSALQTHNGGNAYKKINQNMSFLEDDFNDNLSHFSVAAERFRINIGAVHAKLTELKAKVEFSKINDYECYLEDGGLDW